MAKGYKPSVVRLYDKPDVDHNYGSVKLKDEEAFMFFSAEDVYKRQDLQSGPECDKCGCDSYFCGGKAGRF